MEERVAVGRERWCFKVRGFKARTVVGRILTPVFSPGEREKRARRRVPEGRNVNSRGR
jgi:hypothetical protein